MTTLTAEPTSAVEPASVVKPTAEPSVVRRGLCDRCRCPSTAAGPAGAVGSAETVESCLVTLLPGLQQHPNLDYRTLAYHAEQCDATARDGYWHAAINEARTFLEALVINIALEEERPSEESIADFRKRREAHCGFPSCCRYLEEIGFFNLDERVMVQHTYTLDGAGGIREGVGEEPWSRLVRRMIHIAAQYVIRRYEAWKLGCRC